MNNSSNKAILQSKNTIDPVKLQIDTLQPIKTENHVLVQLLCKLEPRAHPLSNLICIISFASYHLHHDITINTTLTSSSHVNTKLSAGITASLYPKTNCYFSSSTKYQLTILQVTPLLIRLDITKVIWLQLYINIAYSSSYR